MKQKMQFNYFRALFLGAIDGLLIGLIAEEGRISYLSYKISEAIKMARPSDHVIADYFYPSRNIFIPIICMITFAVISCLVYRWFITHPQSLLMLWLVIGAFTLWASYFIDASSPDTLSWMSIMCFIVICCISYWFWTIQQQSNPAIWLIIGVSSVITIAAGAQLVAPFITSTYEYRRPLTWLLCLTTVVILNLSYGFILHLISALHEYSARLHKERMFE